MDAEEKGTIQLEPKEPEGDSKRSILNSVKKLLGIMPEMTEFDMDILMQINSAILVLAQIGVGPKRGFQVTSAQETYEDYLGEKSYLTPFVSMHLFYRTKLGFDPPQSSVMTECVKEAIKECECRLSYEVDPEPEESG